MMAILPWALMFRFQLRHHLKMVRGILGVPEPAHPHRVSPTMATRIDEALVDQLLAEVEAGRRIEAIARLRERTGFSQQDAEDFIDALMRRA
jgi:ribosomal protein L7/L12